METQKLSFWERLVGSADNTTKSAFSGRKLTAMAFTAFAAYIHLKYVDEKIAIQALVVDAVVVLLALSIVTAEQVIKFKQDANQAK